MHHACAARFDVMENLENFWELNKALLRILQRQYKSYKISFFSNVFVSVSVVCNSMVVST